MEAAEHDTKPRVEAIDFEGRRYPRFDIHLPIEYFQIKSSFAHTGNLSEGGSLIYFPEETDVSQLLILKLYFPSGSEVNSIKVLIDVVWMHSPLRKDRKYYQYGVKFVDISPEDETRLRRFLSTLSSPLDDIVDLSDTLRVEP